MNEPAKKKTRDIVAANNGTLLKKTNPIVFELSSSGTRVYFPPSRRIIIAPDSPNGGGNII